MITKIKKIIYILSTILFLMVLAFLVYQIMFLFYVSEFSYIVSLGVICIIGGIALGLVWWDVVYVKGRHFKFKTKKRSDKK